jgi:hypothetical protein
MRLQALPVSLQALQATAVPLWLLTPLTRLQHLSLMNIGISDGSTTVCSLSALQRLTSLHLGCARAVELRAFSGCSGLRELCLKGMSLS